MINEDLIESGVRAILSADRSYQLPSITEENLEQLRASRPFREAKEKLIWLDKRGIGVLGLQDRRYPELLKRIYDPPKLLYYRGRVELLGTAPAIAVVGSRTADPIGLKTAREISSELAHRGNCVVSGLALGIDAAAHQGVLGATASGALTIAVLGNGLSRIYPSSNARLAEELLEAGALIISQFDYEVPPYPANFLNRNRVIAGLSYGVLIVQAALRSGSLVTARYALEEGREVMAIPGSIYEKRHSGCLELLRNGATLVRSVDDILEALPDLRSTRMAPMADAGARLPTALLRIVQKLRDCESLAISEFVDKDCSRMDVEASILELELSGALERLPGNRVTLTVSGRSQCKQARGDEAGFPPADKN